MILRDFRFPPFLFLTILCLISITSGGCRSYLKPDGSLELDPDLPHSYDELLPIGVTLDMADTERDLLNPNILINGDFELAPYLPNCALHPDSTLTTPNGYRTFYPSVEMHYGWEVGTGSAIIQEEKVPDSTPDHFLSLSSSHDSIPKLTLRQRIRVFRTEEGDILRVSLRYRSLRDSLAPSLMLVDSIGHPCSTEIILKPTREWQRRDNTITCTQDLSGVYLQLSFSGLGTLDLDDISLMSEDLSGIHSLRDSLRSIFSRLRPEFVRFPGGSVTNGYYPLTYPDWQHPGRAIWALTGRESSTPFSHEDLLTLCRELACHPIYLVNAGITDPGAFPRSEDISDLTARVAHVAQLAQAMSGNSYTYTTSPIIQFGYGMDRQDYVRRFRSVRQALSSDTLSMDLISSANLSAEIPFSDIIYDAALGDVSSPDIVDYLPFGADESSYLRQPVMLGEVHFDASSHGYYIPALLLKGAFMIEAERHSHLLKGISLSPTLVPQGSPLLGLIEADGKSYRPTPLYDLLCNFVTWRGKIVRPIPMDSLKVGTRRPYRDLYTSLTSTGDGSTYYLKAANTTRHPLTYDLSFRKFRTPFRRLDIIRYIIEGELSKPVPHPPYRRDSLSINLHGKTSYRYTFSPYEFTIFRLTK